jgi:hypothetical protein
MGGSSWSDDHYHDRTAHRVATHTPTFAHDADVRAGRATSTIHASLDPSKIKVRESRDSDAHPNSKAIAVFFDVTGSMGGIPRRLQTELPKLMALLLRKGYVVDPQILMGAIGDYHSDRAPLQVGQFESGIEMDNDLTNIFIEGNGGGQNTESYQNAFYFAARKTVTDCFEKRGEKGYLFLIGDEHPYPSSTKAEIKKVFGDDVEAAIPLAQLVKEAQEKWEIFFIIPRESGTATGDPKLESHWKEVVGGEHVLMLDTAEAICEVIGSTIGLLEGNVNGDDLVSDLKDAGASDKAAKAASKALKDVKAMVVARGGAAASGTLPEKAKRSSTTERL